MVLSTGGGAFMNEETRGLITDNAISVWLKADLETLVQRVKRKDNRPLLKAGDPEEIMGNLLKEREPFYSLASVVVESRNESHESVVEAVAESLLAKMQN